MLGVARIGRYEVEAHLASGGMGQVYLARAKGLGGFERRVVIKTLEADVPDAEALVPMFLDEARVVGALHHQYITPVFEVGRDEDGRYFLVMDYVHGETAEAAWKAARERELPLPIGFGLTVVAAVASALSYAHALCGADGAPLAIVHRDVSPSNVMVGFDGAVKLIDFGIAKFTSRVSRTQVGSLKGKIAYLSPEQVNNKHVDHRADIFALGIVLYELTTMTSPFKDVSDLATLERISRGEVIPPSRRAADYPGELEGIVMKALALDPAERFQDAGELGRAIEALSSRLRVPLGDAAIIDVMAKLFDAPRRRFARSSAEVNTDKLAAAYVDLTPVEPPPDTGAALAAPPVPAGVDDPPTDPMPLPLPPMPPSPSSPRAEPAPLAGRLATGPVTPALARRPPSVAPMAMFTAELPRPRPARPWLRWLVAAAAAIALGIVVALAVR